MEVLSLRVVQAESMASYKIGDKGPSILLLQFADDSLFFLPNKESDVMNLRCILPMFEVCSGLKSQSLEKQNVCCARSFELAPPC